MARARHYFVYIERRSDVSEVILEEVMDRAIDWYRLRDNVWIVYSTSDAEKWYNRLAPIVKDSGSVFICRLNPQDRQGWMARGFWKWLRRERRNEDA